MNISQSTIERMAWWVVALILLFVMIFQIILYHTLVSDDNRKFHILKSNQDTILCIVRESTNPVHTTIDPATLKFTIDNSYIDRCIKANQ